MMRKKLGVLGVALSLCVACGGKSEPSDALGAENGGANAGGDGGTNSAAGSSGGCARFREGPQRVEVSRDFAPIIPAGTEPARVLSGIFTACRNAECYAGSLFGDSWAQVTVSAELVLSIEDASTHPRVDLTWIVPAPTEPTPTSDEYSLSYRALPDAPKFPIFDTTITYVKDPDPVRCDVTTLGAESISDPVLLPPPDDTASGTAGTNVH